MNLRISLTSITTAALMATTLSPVSIVLAQGTAFIYQGQLAVGGTPATGSYDFRFRLAADPSGNVLIGTALLTNGVSVTSGLFCVMLDFGPGIWAGQNYWLEIDVKTNAASGYSNLNPLQPLTPTPYAVFANTASNLNGTIQAQQLAGAVSLAQLPRAVVTNNGTGLTLDGSFSGNGGKLTNINAAALGGLTKADFWQLGGNNVAAGQFIGSTNNQPLEFQVNGGRALRLEYANSTYYGTCPNMVLGCSDNLVTNGAVGATIGGGGYPLVPGSGFDLGPNIAGGNFATVVGGLDNQALGFAATAMGNRTRARGKMSTTMGYQTAATGDYATGMGFEDEASGFAAVAMGQNSTASGFAATAMGLLTTASGYASVAMGYKAKAAHDGSFAWADYASFGEFPTTRSNQFLIRAQGGVGIGATNPVGGAALTIRYPTGAPTNSMPGPDNGLGLGQYAPNGYKWLQSYGGPLTLNPLGNYVGINVTNPVHMLQVGNAYCDGNTWSPSSDRKLKAGFAPANPAEILAKVAALPVMRWHYTDDAATVHLGPVAQDFYMAFGLGADDEHISDVDEGGVALAAIQGLNQKVNEEKAVLEKQLAVKNQEIHSLEARLAVLEKEITSLQRGR